MGTKTLRKGKRAGWTGLSRGIVRIQKVVRHTKSVSAKWRTNRSLA